MNYDPNLFLCGNSATQRVKLTFAMWQYDKEVEIDVSSNVSGLAVLEYAVSQYYDDIINEDGYTTIQLTDDEGNTLTCEDEDDQQEDWLMSMLIGAEIISVTANNNKESKYA